MKKKLLGILSIFLFSSIVYVQGYDLFEFKTLPDTITTNINAYPVTGRVPTSIRNVTVDGVTLTLLSANSQYDFFGVVDLVEGPNQIVVRLFHGNGSVEVITREVNYNPSHSTGDNELVYAYSRYFDNAPSYQYGTLVIDVRNNYFLGILNDKLIKGVTKDGSEIILSTGERYSTKNHSDTGRTLPSYSSSLVLVFSNDGKYVYYSNKRVNLGTNAVEGAVLPTAIEGDADITSDDKGIITRGSYIDLISNTRVSRDYDNGATAYFGTLGVDPLTRYVLHTSFGWAAGELNILHINGSWIKVFESYGDYAGRVVFSPDGKKGYAGFYGNTYYGKGGILIIDMDSLTVDKDFSLHGARSMVITNKSRIYASAFHTYKSNDRGWKGSANKRGIVELAPIDNGTDLEVTKVFFSNLYSSSSDPYYGDNYVFHKPGTQDVGCYSNVDCGENRWIDSATCFNGSVYQNYLTFECNNPGSDSAYCSDSTEFILKDSCEFNCTSGSCNSKPLSTGNVKVVGRKLYVDGKEYEAKSIGYGPTPIGSSPDSGYDVTVHPELRARDFPLLRNMNANTIRTWGKVGQESFLDDAWNNGAKPIRVIMGFWMGTARDYTNPTVRQSILNEFGAYVNAYKNHSAVLVWAIGNEENHFYGSGDANKHKAYFSLVDEMAKLAYNLEGPDYHPVVALSLEMPGAFATIGYEDGGSDDPSIPYVDIWGINHYPGITFGNWFDGYAARTSKPLIITEYGIDALNNTSGLEYELVQANWTMELWQEISASAVTIGGSIMAYADEWWKAGSSSTHNNGGYATGSHPDGYSNEEWWGIVRTVDNGGNPDIMEPRAVYYALKDAFFENEEFNIYLNNGWNLISFPLNLTNKSISSVFSGISFNSIFSYGSWNYYFNESENNFDVVDERDGYWVNSIGGQTLAIEGEQFDDLGSDMGNGWRLKGYNSLSKASVSSLFDNVTVYMYNNSNWYSYVSGRDTNGFDSFIPGYGYWVFKN